MEVARRISNTRSETDQRFPRYSKTWCAVNPDEMGQGRGVAAVGVALPPWVYTNQILLFNLIF